MKKYIAESLEKLKDELKKNDPKLNTKLETKP